MPRVICELDHASDSINGIAFSGEPGAKISEDIPDDIAAVLASIPGFRLAASLDPHAPPATGTGGAGQSVGAGGSDGGEPAKPKPRGRPPKEQAPPAASEGAPESPAEQPPAS